MKHILTLPGDWTHVGLLLRLLEVVEAPWGYVKGGFGEIESGRTVGFAMAGRVEGLAEQFEWAATDPSKPALGPVVQYAIEQHRSVAQIQHTKNSKDPFASWLFALEAANAVIDGGALAVQVGMGGPVFDPDVFQAMFSDREHDLHGTILSLTLRYQCGELSTTHGMVELGLPDLVIPREETPDRAVGRMEAAARKLLAGESLATATDTRSPKELRNPHGIVLL